MAFGERGIFAAERGNTVWLEERIGKEGHPDWRVHLGLLSIVQKVVPSHFSPDYKGQPQRLEQLAMVCLETSMRRQG